MGTEILIRIGDEECTAELLTEQAPQICDAIQRALPLTGVLSHAKLVDREVFFPVPFTIDAAENPQVSQKGDLAFWAARQTVCIFYDDMVPLGATPTFGRIIGNLEGLQREAAKVWESPGVPITLARKGKAGTMQTDLERIKAAREAIWTEMPKEVEQLPDIKATRNQAASTVLYATTKLATLITFLNHMRGIARRGGVDLETMKAVTDPYLAFHAGVFGNFYRLADTAQVVRWAKEALPKADSLEDYAALVGELAIYLNRVDYWIDLQIPWAAFGRAFEERPT